MLETRPDFLLVLNDKLCAVQLVPQLLNLTVQLVKLLPMLRFKFLLDLTQDKTLSLRLVSLSEGLF